MFLVDSNIIIYSYLPQYKYLRNLFLGDSIFVSEITKVEVLGYHKLTIDEGIYFTDVFNLLQSILPSQEILDAATAIRKKYNLKLGDSIICGTALVQGLSIYTRNLSDFEKVPNVRCINPIA